MASDELTSQMSVKPASFPWSEVVSAAWDTLEGVTWVWTRLLILFPGYTRMNPTTQFTAPPTLLLPRAWNEPKSAVDGFGGTTHALRCWGDSVLHISKTCSRRTSQGSVYWHDSPAASRRWPKKKEGHTLGRRADSRPDEGFMAG